MIFLKKTNKHQGSQQALHFVKEDIILSVQIGVNIEVLNSR